MPVKGRLKAVVRCDSLNPSFDGSHIQMAAKLSHQSRAEPRPWQQRRSTWWPSECRARDNPQTTHAWESGRERRMLLKEGSPHPTPKTQPFLWDLSSAGAKMPWLCESQCRELDSSCAGTKSYLTSLKLPLVPGMSVGNSSGVLLPHDL